MPDLSSTLFDKYGGVPGVREMVRQFHERFMAKPGLPRYFQSTDPQRLIQHHVELIAYAMGKPPSDFDSEKLGPNHHPRGITLAAFEQVIHILRQVLLDAKVEGRDIAAIIHRLDLQRHRIVRDAPPVSNLYNPEQIDALTGLANDDALMTVLGIECAEYRDSRRELSLALMRAAGAGRDVLPTKPHLLQILERHLAGVLARTVRESDALSRSFDGKFGLVLRTTDAFKAMQAVRRIQSVIARERFFVDGSSLRIELAIGVASLAGAIDAAQPLWDAANSALQRAEAGTGSRIVAAA
jgi:hemoglobin